VSPQDVKVGEYYYVHPFKVHPNAGSKVVIEKRYGVDFMAMVLHTGESIDLFFSEMWRGKYKL
jgi:imidazoleglycerol phosphate synthase glutamine amidotransferase subunit HisH